HHWRAFGLVLLLSVVALPFEAPSMIAILFTPTWSSGVAIAQHLFDSLLTAFSGAAVFYFYIDLRVRTESLDLEFLAARVERAAEPRLAVDEGNGLL
ncbi:MAG: hypothetical protein MJE66_03680, partial [Proteobacteria bacterium]|nr:hypothetical protein [Pseudomonadota bacterium]